MLKSHKKVNDKNKKLFTSEKLNVIPNLLFNMLNFTEILQDISRYFSATDISSLP